MINEDYFTIAGLILGMWLARIPGADGIASHTDDESFEYAALEYSTNHGVRHLSVMVNLQKRFILVQEAQSHNGHPDQSIRTSYDEFYPTQSAWTKAVLDGLGAVIKELIKESN